MIKDYKMFRKLPNEEWKEIQEPDYCADKIRVFVSNCGRVKRCLTYKHVFELKSLSTINGFVVSNYPRGTNIKPKSFYVHKMVATLFTEQESENKKFVIHKDHNLANNKVKNLKFANQKERTAHQMTNKKFLKALKKLKPTRSKLTVDEVKEIKKLLLDTKNNFSLKQISEKFGVSDMQIYRIKTGENWSHITKF